MERSHHRGKCPPAHFHRVPLPSQFWGSHLLVRSHRGLFLPVLELQASGSTACAVSGRLRWLSVLVWVHSCSVPFSAPWNHWVIKSRGVGGPQGVSSFCWATSASVFFIWAVVNKAAMDSCVWVFCEHVCVRVLGALPMSGIAGSWYRPALSFTRKSYWQGVAFRFCHIIASVSCLSSQF